MGYGEHCLGCAAARGRTGSDIYIVKVMGKTEGEGKEWQ